MTNPNLLTSEELIKNNEMLTQELQGFNKILRNLEKQIRGKYWLWFLLPILGWFIYIAIINKRRTTPEIAQSLMEIKTAQTKNQLQIMLNNRELEKRQETENI
ncbi:hypothetical protein CXP39_02080 [Mesoplasma syrphidae]|uniref:Uncharacterized protein n=1 Tax=Mesoplasma syrphidae TaxID=225999 RepID=A0A2K9BV34_9MOLU|nr:hypothetical protein [Mesoplasma syrphidae]AUF83580.1 hypothetical protein CXP39_02080 [Mesoplasma syrphidae]